MRQIVWVTASFEALHRWPDAPIEVDFLQNLHRHIFHVRLEVLTQSDRQVEFMMLKWELQDFLSGIRQNQGPTSCESFCTTILDEFNDKGYIVSKVTVSEDGENGCTLEVLP